MVIPTNKTTISGPSGTKIALMKVTPKIAADWLNKYNLLNRMRREARVKELSRAMTEGEWMFAGDAVRFSNEIPADTELPNGIVTPTDGPLLLDGQHRLAAIVDSGIPEYMVVVEGLALETQDIIDTGSKRSVADMLKLHGYTNHRALAGALVMLEAHLHYRATGSYGTIRELSHPHALDLIEKHPELVDSVEYARQATRKKRYNDGAVASSLAVAHYEITQVVAGTALEDKAREFFANLLTGYEPYPTSAISAVRNNWQDRVRLGQKGSVNTKTRIQQVGLVLHTWEVYGRSKGRKNLTAATLRNRAKKMVFPLP